MKEELERKDRELQARLDQIEQKAEKGNVINILCLNGPQDYLQTLENQYGDFHQAIDFIQNCALSDDP